MIKRWTDPWTQPFKALRSELGLPPVTNPLFEGQFSRYGTLAIYSKHLGELQADSPPACEITGFAFYDSDRGGKVELPRPLQQFLAEGSAPLVFTLGTAKVMEPGDFYQRSLETARALGRRAVFLGGPNPEENTPEALPTSAFAAGYVPHSLIFPHAAAIVHHGGVGTTAQALRAGKPQLIVPFAGDQPDNAARIVRMGVGRTLSPSAYGSRRAAAELSDLCSDPAIAARAARMGKLVAAEDGASVGADIIEELLQGGSRGLGPVLKTAAT
jgi:rhamnosyltransferase subunit B